MAWPPRRLGLPFSILLFISWFCLALAQPDVNCINGLVDEYTGLAEGIITRLNGDYSDIMAWCPLWAAVCSYFYRNCPTVFSCQFENKDPSVSAQYDLSSPTSYLDFLNCDLCDVTATNLGGQPIPFGALLPTVTGETTPTPTDKIPNGGDPVNFGLLAPDESPNDILVDSPSAASSTSAVTGILVVGGIVGSLVAAKTISSTAAGAGTSFLGGGAGGTTTITNPKTGGGSGQSVIDAVTLLLHFQSVSTSGLLSVSYPALYRFFSYNFAWANLIIASDALQNAALGMGVNPSCLEELGSRSRQVNDDGSPTGIGALGWKYGLDPAMVGGLVYLSAIIGVAVALVVTVLVNVALHILNKIFVGKLQDQVDTWPSRASSMSLRLFIWVFGSVSTFAIYQFADPCSSASLTAFASVEFILITLTLLTVSIFIIKVAKSQGSEALFRLSESEESRYSRKWGSLYARLKPALYWYFIPDYVWVFAKSIIVGVAQGSGTSQVGALIALEVIILLGLVIKRPYATSYGNAFHISSACKRVCATFLLLPFCIGLSVSTDVKRNIGIFLIFIESAYAVALFVVLVYNGGMAIIKWNTERQERKRAAQMATTGPLVSSYPEDSPVQEKF